MRIGKEGGLSAMGQGRKGLEDWGRTGQREREETGEGNAETGELYVG